jgi:serine/threonine-protein kinase
MGEVYRATDLTLAQSVALKFLPEDAASNERLLERFHNEVRIARQVSHPNVCRVYDIGEAEGLPFISMEYVDGEDLASLLHRIGRLPADKALETARKVCAGVAAAHERGIIHRDLKPQNIMLNRRGEVLVMDFGLAAIADELQGPESKNGTPAYMSPEQLRGDSVTPKSDIFALGLIIYELFTGKRAFEAASIAELITAQETTRPLSITSVAADADPAIERVILRCLQIDPAQRPPTALAVAAALPGGDPLAAALAAGETPSPELVAASGKTEGFRLRYAAAYLAFVVVSLAATYVIAQSLSMLPLISLDLPPAVLIQKARETAAALGYPDKPRDSFSHFDEVNPLVRHFERQRGNEPWPKLLAVETPVRYFYRQSPDYLLSTPDGTITADRPPLNLPGMLTLVLDNRGRLREFQAVAPRFDTDTPREPVDPAEVFRMAGFDIAQFQETTSMYAPPLAFDQRRAWKTESFPGLPKTPITLELATWKGVPTSFFIKWPWTRPPGAPPEPQGLAAQAAPILGAIFLLGASGFSIFFARRNLRLGRGDKQGAFRLAAVMFCIYLFTVFVNMHVVPRLAVIGYVVTDVAMGLLMATLLWLLYIALEPAVRARWPHSLITWSRLLAGKFADPWVGSHILIGSALGMALACIFTWRNYWIAAQGNAPGSPSLFVLQGVRPLLNSFSNTLFSAVLAGSLIFFLLCGVRRLVRHDWIAAVIAAILLVGQEGMIRTSQNLVLDAGLLLSVHLLFAFVLLRMGLVPAITALFTLNTFARIPISADWSAWYNPAAAVVIGVLLAIPIYGFWRSQARVERG